MLMFEIKFTRKTRISNLNISNDFTLLYIPLQFLSTRKTYSYKVISRKPLNIKVELIIDVLETFWKNYWLHRFNLWYKKLLYLSGEFWKEILKMSVNASLCLSIMSKLKSAYCRICRYSVQFYRIKKFRVLKFRYFSKSPLPEIQTY